MIMSELKKQRLLKGWTQLELAKRSGIHQVTISLLENGYKKPGLNEIIRLTKALEVDATTLFTSEV